MHPVDFVNKWTGVTLTERSASQQHFLDLCDVLDVPKPAAVDKQGDTYTFEKGAAKSTGGNGWADVWFRGHFGWEYKGPHKDLDKAYDQLLRYKDDLENPPLLVVSDLDRIIIRTNFTGTVLEKHEITLETFADPDSQRTLKNLFETPDEFKPGISREKVTEEAAQRFGQIAQGLQSRGENPHTVAHFLVQMLFCLFAEDIGLLPERVFSRLLDFGRQNPKQFRDETQRLLQTMATGGFVAYETIPHFNGGLFREVHALELTPEEVDVLDTASDLDWSQVEPAIFGTLFERSLDPAQRGQLGAHYTGRADILRVVEPVVMQPLQRRWQEVKTELDTLVARRDAAATTQTRRNREADIRKALQDFTGELAAVTILDPACGSGNFLYVALNQLLNLEKEALTYGATEGGLPMGYPSVGPGQVTGMEINDYAQELAQVVIWIGYLQWMIGNGFGWTEPVLEDLQTIRLQDALLYTAPDDTPSTDHALVAPGPVPGEPPAGRQMVTTETRDSYPRRTVWPKADYIIGNPPFLGGKMLRRELSDDYVDKLFAVYRGEVARESDLCCYFFEQAREAIEEDRTQRVGLLATNSIRGGANREVLKRIKETGDIFMAWDDEPWILAGAAVRIAIVGFDDANEKNKILDGLPVTTINSDLTASVDITGAKPLIENSNLAFQGPVKVGKFDLDAELGARFLKVSGNPHGKPNSEVIRPWVNGMDIVRRPRGMYIIDFGNMAETEAALYEAPFEYVVSEIKPKRINNRDHQRRTFWWRLGRSGDDLKVAVRRLNRYIVTPRVASYRIFRWVPAETLPDSAVVAIAREDDYFFGVLHSRAHEVWSLRMGTWLGKGNDPRYTPTTTFETFPLPWPPGEEPADDPTVQAIAAAAKELNRLRENWLNPDGASDAELKKRTLTNLYNARPTWLTNAHAALDRAVWAAYGWDDPDPATVDEDVILSRLLALNGERAGRG